MIIDSWTYSFLLKELKEILFKDDQNPYLTQIKVVDSFSFLFIFMTANGVKKLLIDTRYSLQCLFILDKGKNIEKATISRKAEHMKMTMRKHIKNHKLIDIYQYKDERLFVFDFDHKKIILELMGQNYNLVLCDKEWIVLSCLRTSDNVYPSNKYIFPEKALETDFYNIDDLKSSKSVFKKTRKSLEKIIDISKTSAFLSYNEQKQKILSPIQINETSKEYISFNKILNKIYSDDKKELLQERILYRTEKDILSDINKIDKKINNIPKKEESKNKIEEYKKNGELLKSNYHILNDNQGQKVIKIFDYVEEIEKEVRIWPELKPDEVIQKYFDLYKKEKRALEHNLSRIEKLISEKKQLQTELENLNQDKILIPQGVQKKKKEERLPGKIKQHIIDGIKVYVGGSASDNDYLLSHIAKGRFMWLHAQKVKGAHVIVAKDFGTVSPELLMKAAKLAAKNSKYSKKKAVPVDYTHVKYVNKVKGVKGKVTFSQSKTIYVNI